MLIGLIEGALKNDYPKSDSFPHSGISEKDLTAVSLTDDDLRRGDEGADEEAEDEDADDDAEPLDEVHVRYLDRLRGPHAEDHRYPGRE